MEVKAVLLTTIAAFQQEYPQFDFDFEEGWGVNEKTKEHWAYAKITVGGDTLIEKIVKIPRYTQPTREVMAEAEVKALRYLAVAMFSQAMSYKYFFKTGRTLDGSIT